MINFSIEKNIAIHLIEDVKLTLEGTHIYTVLAGTKIAKFVRKMALQVLVAQVCYHIL